MSIGARIMLPKYKTSLVAVSLIALSQLADVSASGEAGRKVFLPSVASSTGQNTAELSRVYEEFKKRNATQISLLGSALEASIKKHGRLEKIDASLTGLRGNLGMSPFPKPAFIRNNDLNTAPAVSQVPDDIQLPAKFDFPEIEFEVPAGSTNGQLVWERVKTEAHQIDYATGIVSRPGNAQIHPNAAQGGWKYASNVYIGPTFTQHCGEINYIWFYGVPGYAGMNPNGSFWTVSYLNTWTPTHGFSTAWGFTGSPPNIRTCVPTSLAWTHIMAPGALTAGCLGCIGWVQYYHYNNPNNWWVTWNH
jgi:hypothetical protein